VERLRLKDFESINAFLGELYEFADVSTFRRRLLITVPGVVAAARASLIEFNGRLKQLSGESAPAGAFDGDLARLHRQYLPQSPLLEAYARGAGSAVTYSDFMTQRQLHRLAFYRDYLRRLDIEYLMAKGLPGQPGWITALMLDRKVRDFSERDRLVLNVLGPHLNRSYQNAIAVTASRDQLTQIEHAVDTLDRGLVLLAPAGTVQWMSSRARQWFAVYFGSENRRQGSLPDAVTRWLRRHAERGSSEVPEPREPLVVRRENTELIVRFVSRGGHAVLVLEEQYLSIPPDALRPLGLTRRETEVLAWVAEGKTSAEIASILGLGRRAVEKHLEHIYPKLGVETRTAAAARALALLSTPKPVA
jgi:DNA-binding CsgD family transcriptional regulator